MTPISTKRVLICLVIAGWLILGFLGARYTVDWLLADLPREEIHEALYRDGLAVKYSVGGFSLTIIAAAIIAILESRR